LFNFLQCKAETNVSEYEPKGHAIKAFQEHGSQKVHEFLDQYILTLVPAGVLFLSNFFQSIDIWTTKKATTFSTP